MPNYIFNYLTDINLSNYNFQGKIWPNCAESAIKPQSIMAKFNFALIKL